MSLSPGRYKTKSGLTAIVKRLVSEEKKWTLKGLVEGPKTGAYYICKWDIEGHCLSTESHLFDLVPETFDPSTN